MIQSDHRLVNDILSKKPLSISQLNRQIREWLEGSIGSVFVEGELSNLSKPSSGHLYFTLKDAHAQIKCVLFKQKQKDERKKPLSEGQLFQAHGHLSLYEARGDYQLIIDRISAAGLGDLYQKYEALKIKLAALGLFDPARKKKLPRFPQQIGIISSASGAALQDILSTLSKRFPLARVKIYPSDVQGASAVPDLLRSLKQANQEKICAVLILARGGGSIEDLWAFNDENLAYEIAASSIPIITGIGHETDFTIADFVADLRAATPTAAAMHACPDGNELLLSLDEISYKLKTLILRILRRHQEQLTAFTYQIRSPSYAVKSFWQDLDYQERKLTHAIRMLLQRYTHRCELLQIRMNSLNPKSHLNEQWSRLNKNQKLLLHTYGHYLKDQKQKFSILFTQLNTVSPLNTLERGYAITLKSGSIITETKNLNMGDELTIRLAKGSFNCRVTKL